MKLFPTLSKKHKEQILQMAENLILNGLLENGVQGDPENEEEQIHLDEIKGILDHVKTMPSVDDQVEYLLQNDITSELIAEQAYQIASGAFYIENNENAFFIKDIESNFMVDGLYSDAGFESDFEHGDDDDDDDGDGNSGSEPETPISSSKKDMKHLN